MDFVVPKLGRIAIAVDFGEPSVDAARWVARVLAPDAELVLVHAVDTLAAAPPGVPPPSDTTLGTAREFAAQRLREIGDALGGRGAVRVEVREDRPAPAIASVAEACGADLIAVGPHGGKETARGIGTTAERLIRMSPIPVLLVAKAHAHAPRHLLVPVDDVDLTPAVMHWADLFARRNGVTVSLMHVLDPRWQELSGWRNASARADLDDRHPYPTLGDYVHATEGRLATFARELTDTSRVSFVTPVGVPAEEILAAAARVHTDLIVMGRRGRGRVLPGILGSAASTVLRQPPCPVLIVVDPPDAVVAGWGTSGTSDRHDTQDGRE